MKRIPLNLFWLVALATLSGCISPDASMKALLGQHSSEVIVQWGPPQQRMPDGAGGEIWIYSQERQWTTPGQQDTTVQAAGNTYGNVRVDPYSYRANYQDNSSVSGNVRTTYTPPQTHSYTARRTFFINREGIVYRYSWKGL